MDAQNKAKMIRVRRAAFLLALWAVIGSGFDESTLVLWEDGGDHVDPRV